jgi:hypothetical protein
MLKAREVAEFRYCGHSDGELDTTQALEGVDHEGEPSGLDLVVQFLLQALKTGGVFGDRVHICLKDDLLGRGGTDDLAAPSEVSWPPSGLARRAAIVPQEKRFEPKLGGLEITDGLFTRSAQVPHRFILHRRDVDRDQVTGAHQAGQLDRVTAVGFDPIASLLRDQ